MSDEAPTARVRAAHGAEVERRCRALADAVAGGTWAESLRAEAHALTGATLACGLDDAAVALTALTHALEQDDRDGAARAAATLLRGLDDRPDARDAEAAQVCHDLRSALNVVLGYADLLAPDETDPDRRSWIAAIRDAAGTLAEGVDRLDPTVGRAPPPEPAGEPASAEDELVVLVVEDDEPSAMLARLVLEAHLSTTVAEATTAADAVSQAQALGPDVIVLDGHLPDADAVEVVRRLRADATARAATIVVVTGDRRPEFARSLRAVGADSVLAKPADPAVLAGLVQASAGRT